MRNSASAGASAAARSAVAACQRDTVAAPLNEPRCASRPPSERNSAGTLSMDRPKILHLAGKMLTDAGGEAR